MQFATLQILVGILQGSTMTIPFAFGHIFFYSTDVKGLSTLFLICRKYGHSFHPDK